MTKSWEPYRWAAGLALVAIGSAAFAAGGETGPRRPLACGGYPPAAEFAARTPPPLTLPATGVRPPTAKTEAWLWEPADNSLVRLCGMQAVSLPDFPELATSPPRYPSLGGPTPALTLALGSLPGEDGTPPDGRDDTLRVLRSRW